MKIFNTTSPTSASVKWTKSTSFKEKVANGWANKLESKKIKTNNEKIDHILNVSDFSRIRKQLGKKLSTDGISALAIIPAPTGFQTNYIIDTYRVIGQIKRIGRVEIDIYLSPYQDTPYNKDSSNYTLRYYIKNNTCYLEKITTKDEKEKKELIHTFENINELPVEVFYNNENGLNDFHSIEDGLAALDYLAGEQLEEWKRSSALLYLNSNFSNQSLDETLSEINKTRSMTEKSTLSQLAPGKTIIPASQSSLLLYQLLSQIELDLLDKINLAVRGEAKGTNKFTLEIALANQDRIEQLYSKKTLREEHYNQFFTKLGLVMKTKIQEITLEISDIEQSIFDLLSSNVVEAEMAKDNKQSQIDSNKDKDKDKGE